MKRRSIFILLLSIMLFSPIVLIAQDTGLTAGVTFTPINGFSVRNDSTSAKKVETNRDHIKIKVGSVSRKVKTGEKQTFWVIFIAGLAGGFAALLMPCIFPMLPLTVSFFTKNNNKKGSAGVKAIIYGISIIAIYVIMGLLVTVLFGADALNSLSTNGVFNFAFFVLIIFFAASFLGAFEITLPSRWVNRMDRNSDKGGIIGLFFMAATLALVSFSCTGPIIGTLLVQAATTGALLGPAIGMFGFAFALSIPFVFFALFPSWLRSLPKSGGWLNSVKVTLGFLELALAFKFLSNVDLAYHWHLLDREVFLVLWIIIFSLMGLYLLGKLKLNHDGDLNILSVPRLFLAIIIFSFSLYMVPGLFGAPLKAISAFLPPMSTQDFDLSSEITNSNASQLNRVATADTSVHKYADLFDKPKGFNPFFDYDEGMSYAKRNHKPVIIDFTGHACVNCRKMEANVWTVPEIKQVINNDYVLIQLYVDDKTDLPSNEQYKMPEGRKITSIGAKWSNLQTSKFQTNSQPFYVLLDPLTQSVLVNPEGADYDSASFIKFLKSGLKAFSE